MNKTEFMLLLDGICVLDPGTVKPENSLSDSGIFDSLAILELIAVLDKTFGVCLAIGELQKIDNVEALFNRVMEQRHNEEG